MDAILYAEAACGGEGTSAPSLPWRLAFSGHYKPMGVRMYKGTNASTCPLFQVYTTMPPIQQILKLPLALCRNCLLYTSDAADE